MSEGQFKMQPVSDYKTSSYYRSMRHFLDQGDLGTALQEATNLCHNEQPVEHLENFASMVEVDTVRFLVLEKSISLLY